MLESATNVHQRPIEVRIVRLVLLLAGALMGLLVAIEAANFAIQHMALKGLPRMSQHAGQIEIRIWTAIAVASIAWIATVKLTALSLTAMRAGRRG
ncbi:MAG: hypothetical protein RLZ98_322 [Pseudomonadota bacterium]|jgi:flagellar biosynthesis protein FliQ